MVLEQGFRPVAGLSALAATFTLVSCSDGAPGPEESPDQQASSTDESGEVTAVEGSGESHGEEGADDDHVLVDESETEEPDPAALAMCDLIRPDVLEGVFGQEFDDPEETQDGASCRWEASDSDGDYIELESATTSAEEWEALRQELGVMAEFEDYGDGAFMDDESTAHIWFEDVSITVTAAVSGSDYSQQEEVIEEVSANLDGQH